MRVRWVAALAAVLLLVGACNDNGHQPFAGNDRTTVTLPGDQVLSVLVSDTDKLRQRGLSEVTDLAGYDGMLFTYPSDTDTQFWMKDTKFPLDVAFMAADGTVLQTFTMAPCTTDDSDCPRYGPTTSYRYALEVPAGSFDRWQVTAGSRLHIE